MYNYAHPARKTGTKPIRFNKFAEARLGVDGMWRLWELCADSEIYGATGHAQMEYPGSTWVVTQTAQRVSDLRPQIAPWRR